MFKNCMVQESSTPQGKDEHWFTQEDIKNSREVFSTQGLAGP